MKKIILYLGSLIFTGPCISLIACSNPSSKYLLIEINKDGFISSSSNINLRDFEENIEIQISSSLVLFMPKIVFEIYNIKGDKETFVFQHIEIPENDGTVRSTAEQYEINKDEILKMYNWLINKN